MKDELHVGITEGVTQGSKIGEEDKPKLGIPERPGTLAEWSRDRVFFNHGLWFSQANLDRDIIVDVCAFLGADLMPVIFPKPIFLNIESSRCWALPWLPKAPLNNLLLAVAAEHWGPLADELRCFSWIDRNQGMLYRSVYQELRIIDQLAMDRLVLMPLQLPLTTIVALGVESNKRALVFQEATAYPGSLSQVITLPPRQETIDLAAAHLAEHAKPFRVFEPEDPFEGLESIIPPTS